MFFHRGKRYFRLIIRSFENNTELPVDVHLDNSNVYIGPGGLASNSVEYIRILELKNSNLIVLGDSTKHQLGPETVAEAEEMEDNKEENDPAQEGAVERIENEAVAETVDIQDN